MTKWIKSAKFDWWWFIAPQLIPAIAIFFLPSNFLKNQETEIFPISWVLIVLCVDVTHVYAIVYKTYLKKEAWGNLGVKMKIFPFLVWLGGIFIYSISSYLFWSLLAYFAVYHFIRQQYGFFRLYTRIKEEIKWKRFVLNITIYSCTVIPILIWHCRGQQNFNWMQKGDFKYWNLPQLEPIFTLFLVANILIYLYLEFKEKETLKSWNWGRILITLSTGFAWYVSILMINNDFTFSLVNVLGHGIPYFALVWLSERKNSQNPDEPILRRIYGKAGILLFVGLIFCMAYLEEGFWDTFIWREHSETFGWMYFTENIEDNQILAFIIPLLIMPQVVHYILDAYIWKNKS